MKKNTVFDSLKTAARIARQVVIISIFVNKQLPKDKRVLAPL